MSDWTHLPHWFSLTPQPQWFLKLSWGLRVRIEPGYLYNLTFLLTSMIQICVLSCQRASKSIDFASLTSHHEGTSWTQITMVLLNVVKFGIMWLLVQAERLKTLCLYQTLLTTLLFNDNFGMQITALTQLWDLLWDKVPFITVQVFSGTWLVKMNAEWSKLT